MTIVQRIICVVIGYFIGCIQTAYFTGKVIAKIDIREHGSGNAGMTNINRVLGSKIGLFVFICDILKAVLGYTVCSLIFDGSGAFLSGVNGVIPGLYAGIGVILGHNFPVFLKFKGGKGIAASIGVILCFDWRIAVIVYALAIIIVILTKYISLASLLLVGLFPVLMIIFSYPAEAVVFGFILMGLAYYMHRTNISRLLHNKENKFAFSFKNK